MSHQNTKWEQARLCLRIKNNKKSHLIGESRTIIQELKLPSLTCQNIILPFNQMEKQSGLPQVGGLFLHVIGLRENEVFYHYMSLILF